MQRKATLANTETETGSIDTRIDHLRDELKKAVNDKQYSALLAEMNTLKERRKAFEDDLFSEMSAIEELEAVATEIHQRTEEREKVLQVASKELKTRESEISEQLAELEKERDAAAAVGRVGAAPGRARAAARGQPGGPRGAAGAGAGPRVAPGLAGAPPVAPPNVGSAKHRNNETKKCLTFLVISAFKSKITAYFYRGFLSKKHPKPIK